MGRNCELCNKVVLKNPLGEKRKRILCDDCFFEIKQTITYWYSERKFGREAISKKILELFAIFLSGKLIENLLVSWDYEKRERVEAIRLRYKENPGTILTGYAQRQIRRHAELVMPIEKKFGKSYEEIINELYWKKEKSYSDIGRELGLSETTIKNWNNRKRRQKGRTVQQAMVLSTYREKQKIIAIRRRLTSNQIGPITSAFLANPTGQFSVLTAEEIYSMFLGKSIKSLRLRFPKDLKKNFLIRLSQMGSIEAKNKLIEDHLWLVSWIIKEDRLLTLAGDNSSFEYHDIFNTGILGLMKAIEGWPFIGDFMSYASTAIHRTILNYFCDYQRLIRLPKNFNDFIVEQKKTSKSDIQIAELAAEKFGVIKSVFLDLLSTDLIVTDDGGTIQSSFISNENSVFKLLGTSDQFRDDLWKMIQKVVGERNAKIIKLRFFHNYKYREIGEDFNIDKSSVAKVLDYSLKKLAKSPEFLNFVRENYGIE